MPLGWSRSNASSAELNGAISRIDAGLADAARDQLRHLAAEVDDEDGFGGLDRHGGRIESASPRVKFGSTRGVCARPKAAVVVSLDNEPDDGRRLKSNAPDSAGSPAHLVAELVSA